MPRLCSFSRLSLAVLLLAVLGSVAWAKPKVAILGLEATNAGAVDPKDATAASTLTEALRSIPRNGIGKFDFAPNSNRELQDEKLMGNCDNEKPGCMAPIGSGLGADVLIFGSLAKGAEKGKDGYKVSLKLLIVGSKPPKLEGPEDFFIPMSTLNGGADGIKDWAQRTYAKITGDKVPAPTRVESGPGKLVILSNAKSGDVFLDGSKKGRLDDGSITLTVPEGSYELAIEASGFKRYEATVTVKSGPPRTVKADLEELVGPVVGGGGKSNTALKVTGYGLAGAALGAGAYVLYLSVAGPITKYSESGKLPFDPDTGNMVERAGSDRCDESGLRKPLPMGEDGGNNKLFDESCKANTRRNIAAAVGVAGGVLGLGALLFAYRSESKSAEKPPTAAGKRQRRQFTVTPVISPNGGGATVRFDW